jgi:hypothetical protein
MRDDLGWFWQTDRVIAVLHVAGGRGGAIHQLISFSPEVPKRKVIDVENGAAHANQEGLGYRDPYDASSQFNLHERWSGHGTGTWPRSAMHGRSLEDVRAEISTLRTRYGEPITDSVARGCVLSYRCYPSMDDGGIIWPNRRVVAVYHKDLGKSLREWYQKGLDVPMAGWQSDHLGSLGVTIGGDPTVLDYYTVCHGNWAADRTGHKEYLRGCLPAMARNQSAMLSMPGIHPISIDEFFSDGWHQHYIELCSFCGITPNAGMAGEFMNKYLSQQWRRDNAG